MAFAVQDPERLLGVGAPVLADLLLHQLRTQRIFIRRIAHARGVIADQEDGGMAQFLELAQLAHGDGMAEVQIRRGGIVAGVHAQRAPFLAGQDQALAQFDRHRLLQRPVSVFRSLH